MNVMVREATVEDAHAIVTAGKEIAKTPGYFCSQPDELSEENVIKKITKLCQSKKGIYFVAINAYHAWGFVPSPNTIENWANLEYTVEQANGLQ